MTAMNRAEGICACINIIDLAECLDETLPAQYAHSVHDKISSMRDFIKNEWRGSNITEKMDRAIRNTWDGLRRWDRKEQHNDELFYGLSDIDIEPAKADAPAARAAKDPLEEAKKKGKRGIETGTDLSDLSKEELDKLEAMRQQSLAAAAEKAEAPAETQKTKTAPGAKGVTADEILRQREQTISIVRKQFHEKRIRVIDIDTIKHGDLTAVLKKTSSDRTKQLLEAAFCAGKITGAYLLAEELKLRVK